MIGWGKFLFFFSLFFKSFLCERGIRVLHPQTLGTNWGVGVAPPFKFKTKHLVVHRLTTQNYE